jgi:hypothetical protein
MGEQPGVPFYRPRSRDVPDVPLAYWLASNDIAVIGCLDGTAHSEQMLSMQMDGA